MILLYTDFQLADKRHDLFDAKQECSHLFGRSQYEHYPNATSRTIMIEKPIIVAIVTVSIFSLFL